ncbi:hypothetical protein VTL71DRAFT_3534 [Oculimacula yallundae]|uniref:Uncharacterized protein n=1 Tax=Oculimacula yallundae TaxID=86028 RepID=A0ABR4C7J0_9HELO
MLAKTFITSAILLSLVASSPFPGQNVPFTDAEWVILEESCLSHSDIGIQARAQNVPITESECAALELSGLSQDDIDIQSSSTVGLAFVARGKGNKVMNCERMFWEKQPLEAITSDGCHCVNSTQPPRIFVSSAYSGTDISKGHETSDTYPVFLTNQDSAKDLGAKGNVAFAIFDTIRSPAYPIDSDTWSKAMQAPFLAYLGKTHKK